MRMRSSSTKSWIVPMLAVAALAASAGCGGTHVETTYGRTIGRSVNGTGAFAELLRDRGHEVRAARRLNDELAEWADTIVRFAPHPGPIERDEAAWYLQWQEAAPGRRLVFVCRDGGAEAEYWAAALENLPPDAPKRQRERIERKLGQAEGWGSEPPPPGIEPADPGVWFGLDASQGLTRTSTILGGPWSDGVDPKAAALPIRRSIEQTSEWETPLLTGDNGRVLAMAWSWEDWGAGDPSAVLVVANGSFLLNAAIVTHARRPLTMRVAEWAGDAPRNVAFVEGQYLLGAESPMPTPWDVVRQVPELGMVAGHFMAMALLAALAHSVTLGRPRPAPPSGADRPSAHAEALGHLMARLGAARAARSLLATYRRWRRPQAHDDRPPADHP